MRARPTPTQSVTTRTFTHLVDPEEAGVYGYSVCYQVTLRDPRGVVYMPDVPMRPATCFWCIAGRYWTTDVGF